jgi:co-chaperonin GroES (HSP10)
VPVSTLLLEELSAGGIVLPDSAKEKPMRIVFRDNGFKDDTAKTNVKQLLKQLSPETEMKVI